MNAGLCINNSQLEVLSYPFEWESGTLTSVMASKDSQILLVY